MQTRRHLLLAGLVMAAAARLAAQPFDPRLLADVRWRLAGPFRGGRVLAVAGVPGQPEHFYFGAVGGGVWESENAGRTWQPIFDGQPIASIGAIAVAPSDPSVLYVGSGEADMRSDISLRQRHVQVLRRRQDVGSRRPREHAADRARSSSIRATRTSSSSRRSATATAPTRSAASSARRTAARTWSSVLFKDEDTGAIDLAFDPCEPEDDPRRALADAAAALEHLPAVERSRQRALPLGPTAATPGSRSRAGFPSEKLGRIGIAFAPERSAARLRDRGREGGRPVRLDRRRRDVDARERGPANLGARLVLRRRDGRSEGREHGLRVQHRPVPLDRRRQDVPADQGRSGRRRLPPALDRSGRAAPHDPRQRPGRGRQRRRREDVELLVQPADRAVLPRGHRRPRSRTGSTARSRTAAPRRRRRARTTPPSRCATGAPLPRAARTATSLPTPRTRTSSTAAA